MRSVAAVFVLPYAQLATGTEHERHVVQFLSQLHDDVSFSLEEIQDLLGDTAAGDAGRLLAERIGPQPGQEVLGARLPIATSSFLHAAAIWARGQRREHRTSDETLPLRTWSTCSSGRLTAPVGAPVGAGPH